MGIRSRVGRTTASPATPAPAVGVAPKRLVVLIGRTDPPEGAWTVMRFPDLPATPGTWAEVVLRAASLADLRAALPWLSRAGRATTVTVRIDDTDRPDALRPPATVLLRPPTEVRLQRPTGSVPGPVSATVTFAKPTRVVSIARALLAPSPAGGRAHRTAGLQLGLTDGTAAAWAAGDALAEVLVDAADADPVPVDVVIGLDPPSGRAPLVLRSRLDVPPVDTAVCSPRGFSPATKGPAEVRLGTGSAEVHLGDGTTVHLDPALTENDIRTLRPVESLRVADTAAAEPGQLGRLLTQLCCAGVPVHTASLPGPVTDVLGPALTARLQDTRPATFADPTERESWSLTTRRLALGRWAPAPFWSAHARALGCTTPRQSVSALLTTRRPALLEFALAQLGRQDWAELEVVVVLHGSRADSRTRALAAAARCPVTLVEVDADVVFGEALNRGLAACSGSLVTKVDDDDWYGPHHVTDLVQAHEHSGATLVGCGGYHVYLTEPDLTVRWTNRPTEAPTTWVHGGTMLLAAADLRALGGWRAVPLGEDARLLESVRATGGTVYGIHDLGFTYYRGREHTWNPDGGAQRWLTDDRLRRPGFAPPPQVEPLPHPALG